MLSKSRKSILIFSIFVIVIPLLILCAANIINSNDKTLIVPDTQIVFGAKRNNIINAIGEPVTTNEDKEISRITDTYSVSIKGNSFEMVCEYSLAQKRLFKISLTPQQEVNNRDELYNYFLDYYTSKKYTVNESENAQEKTLLVNGTHYVNFSKANSFIITME